MVGVIKDVFFELVVKFDEFMVFIVKYFMKLFIFEIELFFVMFGQIVIGDDIMIVFDFKFLVVNN